MVLTLPKVDRRIICQNCLIFDLPESSKNAINIKEFLDNYKKNEEEINHFVDDNLEFIKFFESSVDI